MYSNQPLLNQPQQNQVLYIPQTQIAQPAALYYPGYVGAPQYIQQVPQQNLMPIALQGQPNQQGFYVQNSGHPQVFIQPQYVMLNGSYFNQNFPIIQTPISQPQIMMPPIQPQLMYVQQPQQSYQQQRAVEQLKNTQKPSDRQKECDVHMSTSATLSTIPHSKNNISFHRSNCTNCTLYQEDLPKSCEIKQTEVKEKVNLHASCYVSMSNQAQQNECEKRCTADKQQIFIKQNSEMNCEQNVCAPPVFNQSQSLTVRNINEKNEVQNMESSSLNDHHHHKQRYPPSPFLSTAVASSISTTKSSFNQRSQKNNHSDLTPIKQDLVINLENLIQKNTNETINPIFSIERCQKNSLSRSLNSNQQTNQIFKFEGPEQIQPYRDSFSNFKIKILSSESQPNESKLRSLGTKVNIKRKHFHSQFDLKKTTISELKRESMIRERHEDLNQSLDHNEDESLISSSNLYNNQHLLNKNYLENEEGDSEIDQFINKPTLSKDYNRSINELEKQEEIKQKSGQNKKQNKKFTYLIQSSLFKLNSCRNRFELIYKNLLRDVRKSFWLEFNQITDFNSYRRRQKRQVYYLECLEKYVSECIDHDLLERASISPELLLFYLGALIYPKDMVKNYNKNSIERKEILKVHSNLYQFSFRRLQKLIQIKPIIILLIIYLNKNGLQRIERNEKFNVERTIYSEALEKMITLSQNGKDLVKTLEITFPQVQE
eukprot:403369965